MRQTTCEFCSASFPAQRSTARYCTNAHRAAATRQRMRLLNARLDEFRLEADAIIGRMAAATTPEELAATAADAAAFTPRR